ncbi:hypothetical protein [Dysgonomonas sp. ZJ709]|uniref:hypothetical protein n=1 Tax=Dysgonomonas sp. ZJ709 TaxID=2709797 RepID=UPI0013EC35AF|nr:hypothetical protein [Dysgonomonas sp. ZJ709]
MKKILFLVIIGLGITWSQMQAQTYIFPKNNELIANYYSTQSSGSLYYQSGNMKVKPNSTFKFNLSSIPFWSGCTNFTWYLNLPGNTSTAYERDCKIEFNNATGWAMITIDAIDKDGYTHKNCSFMVEVSN